MLKWMLAAGAAALAIAAPTAAERGGKAGDQSAQARKADRQNSRAQRGSDRQMRAERGGREGANRPARVSDRAERRATRVERTNDRQAGRAAAQRSDRQQRQIRAERPQTSVDRQERRADRQDRRIERQERRVERQQVRQDRTPVRDRARVEARRDEARMDRRAERAERALDRQTNRGRAVERFADVSRDPVFRVRDIDRRGNVRLRDVNRDQLFVRRLGYVDGCPPGLAKKANGCLPPGQASKFIGQPLQAASRVALLEPMPSPFRSLYWDNDDYYYRYGGGYLYRVDRHDNLIAAMIPLFGAALLGQQLQPYYVNNYYRPPYYSSFYRNSPYDCYQYGYGYIYETDCVTGMVEDVIPTYDYGYGVGQLMPASYGYYNVPFAYRSYFADDDDYYYRYAPGAIYRVDRDTALISAVVALLSGGLSVGQPLPIGYNAYNVPLAYRSTYYDRPDMWYRYDNGYIYGVDPRTRVVQSIAYTII